MPDANVAKATFERSGSSSADNAAGCALSPRQPGWTIRFISKCMGSV
jgi:hypothetical protein